MSTLCPLPWIHLASHPEGKVTLCCISEHACNMSAARTNGETLNLNKHSVFEIVNNDYFKKTRLEMLAGVKPTACSRCYREEELTGKSKRLSEKLKFSVDYSTNTDGSIIPNLKFIELRLGNLCNVKCRTCNPASSTQWIQEYNKLQQELNFVANYDTKINTDWTQSDKFWDDLLENSKDIELIYINGGEPTLVEKHWTYLERLIDANLNEQVTLWYNINMTNVPDNLVNIWRQFKKVIVHGSIDDINERNSYIRKGTNWNSVESNLIKLKSLDWIELHVTQTVSWLNIYYVPEFNDYFESHQINTHINLVYDPIFLSPFVIPNYAKEELFKKFSGTKFNWLIPLIKTGEDLEIFKQGVEYNRWLDRSRNENFQTHFSEWTTILRI
jgi:organic radical activating enzyme